MEEVLDPIIDKIVTINIGDKKITCKKNTLMKGSDYFRAMFSSNMIESRNDTVKLHDVDIDIISRLIKCLEVGELEIGDRVTDLLESAVMLQIPSAISSCITYIKMILDDTNCLNFMEFAASHGLQDLYSWSKRHSLYYFSSVIKQREYLELDSEDVIDYISDQHLNCGSELGVLHAIHIWYNHDVASRGHILHELLECFCPEDLKAEEWEAVCKHPIMKDTNEGKAWVEKHKHLERIGDLHSKSRKLPMTFLTFGGVKEVQGRVKLCTDICRLDPGMGRFIPYQDLSHIYPEMDMKTGFRVTVVGRDIYLTGGQPNLTRSKFIMDVFKFDTFKEEWSVVTKAPKPRRHHGACASDTCLFLLGGFGKYRDILSSFDKYDTVQDTWQELPNMLHPCYSPTVTYDDNKLYLFKVSVSYFDFSTHCWSKLDLSHDGFHFICPAIKEGYIYEFPCLDTMDVGLSLDDSDEQNQMCVQYNLRTNYSKTVPVCDGLKLGHRVIYYDNKFYTFNCDREKGFVSFVYEEETGISKLEMLGLPGDGGANCELVPVPFYPDYAISQSRRQQRLSNKNDKK